MFGSNGPSLSDIAAVMGNGNGNGGFGGGIWALIILFALFGGYGRGGWGAGASNGGGCNCATPGDIQRGFDNQGVTNKLNGLENGICSLGYDQLSQMNSLNTNVLQTGNAITNAISQASVANMQQANSLSSQLAQCCCDEREAIAQVRYDMSTDTCSIINAITQAAQNIVNNDNANYRQLHDENVAIQMQAKDDTIAELRTALGRCDSQSIANSAVQSAVNQLRWGNQYGCGCGSFGFNGCCGNSFGFTNNVA